MLIPLLFFLLVCEVFANENGYTYNIKARVSFRSKDSTGIKYAKKLTWQQPEKSTNEKWFLQGENWIWPPAKEALPLSVPITLANVIKAGDFDQILIDYADLFPNSHCDVDLKLSAGLKGQDENFNFYTGKTIKLTPLHAVDLMKIGWHEKDNLYRVKRKLSLPFENTLRYTQDDNVVVLQRRFNLSLNSYDAIEFSFLSGTIIKEISLRIKVKNVEKVVKWNSSKLQADIVDEDGKMGVRFWLPELINEYSSGGREKIMLQEVLVHLPGNASYILSKRPFKKILFHTVGQGEDSKIKQQGGLITKKIDYFAAGKRKRMSVDISKLDNYKSRLKKAFTDSNEFFINTVDLKINPSNPKHLCGIKLRDIKLVSSFKQKEPLFFKDINKTLMELTDNRFLLDNDNNGSWIDSMAGFLSFAFGRPGDLYTDAVILNKQVYISDFLDYTGEANVTPDYYGLKFDGAVKHMTLKYPEYVDVKSDAEYKFWFGFYESLSSLSGATLILNYKNENEKKLKFPISPNAAINIGKLPAGKVQMSLEANFRETRKHILLVKEMFLYTLGKKSRLDIIMEGPSFSRHWFALNPVCNSAGSVEYEICKKNSIKLIAYANNAKSDRAVKIKIDVKKPVELLQWLSFSYIVPWQLSGVKADWLAVVLEGQGEKIKKSLNLPLNNSEINLYIPSLVGNSWSGGDILDTITFVVDGIYGAKKSDEPFSLTFKNMALSLSGMASLRESLTVNPILKVEGKQVFLPFIKESEAMELINGGVWMDIMSISRSGGPPSVVVEKNPMVNIDDLVIESNYKQDNGFFPFANKTEEAQQKVGILSKIEKPLFILSSIFLLFSALRAKSVRHIAKVFFLCVVKLLKTFDMVIAEKLNWLSIFGFTVIAGGFYVIGLTASTGKADNYSFTLGSLALFMAIRIFIMTVRSILKEIRPSIVERFFSQKGDLYIIGFIALLFGTLTFSLLKLEPVASQLAIIGFYFFMTAVIKRLVVFHRHNNTKGFHG